MRVYVSGIGLVSTLGIGREKNWKSFLESVTNVQKIPEHWNQYANFNSTIWSPLQEPDYQDLGFRKTEVLQLDPASLLALISVREALDHASIIPVQKDLKKNNNHLSGIDPTSVAVNFGVGLGGGASFIANHSFHLVHSAKKELESITCENDENLNINNRLACPSRYNPFVVSMLMANSIPASIALKYTIKGAVTATVQACSSGTTSVGHAYNMIKRGAADLVVSGGVEYAKDDYGSCFRGFDAARALVPVSNDVDIQTANRPFDVKRSGFLFSEGGSATLILESEKNLEERGVEPIAEVVGFGESFDAHSIMAPEPSGEQIERMMRMALDDAGATPDEIDYINAHGTSTVANDKTESAVIERVFGKNVAISSTKSIIGHTLGASGAIEAAVCALSLRDQEIHPSLNLENPLTDLDFVTKRRKAKLKYVFTESFAFGGHNSGLVLKAL